MFSFKIAINLIFLTFFYFSLNVSCSRLSCKRHKSSDGSFIQVQTTLNPDFSQQNAPSPQAAPPQVASPPPPPPPGAVSVDPEGLKKMVQASVLASQAVPPNGPVVPQDVNNVAPVPVPVPVPNQVPNPVPNTVPNVEAVGAAMAQAMSDNFTDEALNVLLDPSLPNISRADKVLKNNMERSVHSLKKSVEHMTEFSSLLNPRKQNESFVVEGDDYTLRSTLDKMNKCLRELETVQKVVFQANAFVLSNVANAASGSTTPTKSND